MSKSARFLSASSFKFTQMNHYIELAHWSQLDERRDINKTRSIKQSTRDDMSGNWTGESFDLNETMMIMMLIGKE